RGRRRARARRASPRPGARRASLVETQALERERGTDEPVAEGVVTPRRAQVLRGLLDGGLDRGRVRDPLPDEQRGQGGDMRGGLARAHHEEVAEVVEAAEDLGG